MLKLAKITDSPPKPNGNLLLVVAINLITTFIVVAMMPMPLLGTKGIRVAPLTM